MWRALALMLLSGAALATPNEITGPYQCNTARFYVTSSAEMQRVTLRIDGRIYDLQEMRTASGAAWSNAEWVWWTKGADSFLERNGQLIAKDCKKKLVY